MKLGVTLTPRLPPPHRFAHVPSSSAPLPPPPGWLRTLAPRTPLRSVRQAFSYLTAVLRCPLPRDTLRAHLKSLPALCSYVEAFSTTFFGSFEPLPPSPETDPRLRPPPLTGRPTAFPYAFGADEGGGGEASEAAAGGGKSSRTPKQRRFKERSRNAVLGALGGALVYAVATDLAGGERRGGPCELRVFTPAA